MKQLLLCENKIKGDIYESVYFKRFTKGQVQRYSANLALYRKKFKNYNFTILDVGQKIKAYENDMSKAVEEIKKADLIVFSYPVYTFIATSQLHRFIELLKKEKLDLNQKFATQVTTSKHFYGVGGMKIFRDLIYVMRGLMKVDHKFYKKHGVYDFPQKQRGRILFIMLIGGLASNPKMQKKWEIR